MRFDWDALPATLESKMLPGTVGKMHLTGLARTAMQLGNVQLGAEMLLAAWEADPLDGMLAGQLLAFLPESNEPGLRTVLEGLAKAWQPDSYIQRLQEQAKTDQLFSVLENKLAGKERSLFLLQRAVELGLTLRPLAWAKQFLESPWPETIRPAIEYTLSGVELMLGDIEQARDRCRALLPILPLSGVLNRIAECELRMGNRDQALAVWHDALAGRPWDVSTLLKVHDVTHGLDQKVTPLDGPVNIFLYTFNKAKELDQALGTLADTALDNAHLTVLDNGSEDDTQGVLSKWQEQFGTDRFDTISLPINIGAPAARNWLMHTQGAAERPWSIYLDDDAMVPHDWLGRLGAAVEAYPDAGVWGCKVIDAQFPHVIQNADLHPRPDYAEDGVFPVGETSDLHHQTFDTGGFDFLRPCASVTGCCHLFRTDTLLKSGGFDIALSPSQFDDFDHDLRMLLDGKKAVYQGHLAVRHMKQSGKLSQQGGMAYFNGVANHSKLKAKHEGGGWEQIRTFAHEAVRADIRRKAEQLYED
ncbi:MAG: glycosyltransferase [Pseudodesulfovibrio sp.]